MAASVKSTVPAQLGFLAIYNPSFGTSDETLDDQIAYYASVNTQSQKGRRKTRARPTDNVSQEERNERLRQIGLAQGMVEFGKGFSGDQPVDTIETEKSRVILHELEPGWWILASIDLTQLPLPAGKSTGTEAESSTAGVEYSSREVKPAALLLQDLLRAHSMFLLHHDSSLSAMFLRHKRTKFTVIMRRFWDPFIAGWNVMLHGNPARNVFGGIKFAACGELGMGVGEEERGSGEREVLESMVDRVEGLVDLVVSKFGDFEPTATSPPATGDPTDPAEDSWLGTGKEPGAEDGVIFLGTGVISKHSLRDLTYWMEDLYTWGDNAYGVRDSPTSMRQSRKHRKTAPIPEVETAQSEPPMQPPPPVTELAKRSRPPPAGEASGSSRQSPAGNSKLMTANDGKTQSNEPSDKKPEAESGGSMEKYASYFKLGYGTYWGHGSSNEEPPPSHPAQAERPPLAREVSATEEAAGHFLIGLKGKVQKDSDDEEDSRFRDMEYREYNSRTMLRTVTVELENDPPHESMKTQDFGSQDNDLTTTPLGHETEQGRVTDSAPNVFDSQDRNKTKKLRVVVYVNRPFIFTLLYRVRTDSLAWDGAYKSLHQQFVPLHRSLVNSTYYRPDRPDTGPAAAAIYDLIWDPKALTVHSTIPNIPEPNMILPPGEQPIWSRAEALNTHLQLLNTYTATRADWSETERTCKTSRGWWVVWSRILQREIVHRTREQRARRSSNSTSPRSSNAGALGEEEDEEDYESDNATPTQDFTISKEIFLLRRASDHAGGSGVRAASASLASAAGGGSGWADGASRLAQGIGVDTKKYIEGLLSLNR